MESINVADARKHFSDLMARVAYRGERVVVERHGRPMMAWVSMADLARLQALEAGSDALSARHSSHPLPPSEDLLDQLRAARGDDLSSNDHDLR